MQIGLCKQVILLVFPVVSYVTLEKLFNFFCLRTFTCKMMILEKSHSRKRNVHISIYINISFIFMYTCVIHTNTEIHTHAHLYVFMCVCIYSNMYVFLKDLKGTILESEPSWKTPNTCEFIIEKDKEIRAIKMYNKCSDTIISVNDKKILLTSLWFTHK